MPCPRFRHAVGVTGTVPGHEDRLRAGIHPRPECQRQRDALASAESQDPTSTGLPHRDRQSERRALSRSGRAASGGNPSGLQLTIATGRSVVAQAPAHAGLCRSVIELGGGPQVHVHPPVLRRQRASPPPGQPASRARPPHRRRRRGGSPTAARSATPTRGTAPSPPARRPPGSSAGPGPAACPRRCPRRVGQRRGSVITRAPPVP